jgi:hypothetical protein
VTLAVVAAVVLGLTFLLAGVAKIASGQQWPVQAGALGAPRWAIPVVPWLEIVLGATLCTQIVRPLAATGAAVLLIVFSALLASRLRQGQHPPCACFGSLRAKPLSWRHLLRNVALIALAGAAALF